MVESSLSVALLGAFRVLVDGTPVDEPRWTRRKAKTLVKLLALEPAHELPRDRLQELLWPDVEPEAALNNFHKTLHAARRALEPELKSGAESRFLLTADQRVALRSPGGLRIDSEEFERAGREALAKADALEPAIALYTGELLPEDRLEDWAAVPRERLAALHQELLLRWAQRLEAAGDARAAVDVLNQAVTARPANEAAQRRLMTLYVGLGNRSMALAQYRACVAALKKELDAEPEAATVKLFEEIQEGQRGAIPAAMPAALPAAPPLPPITRRRWGTWLGGVAIATGGGAALWWNRRSPLRIGSLAVMPFAAGNDAALAHVPDGLTEALINSLSQLPDLRVMARSTVFAYKDRAGDPRALGRAVGAAAVLVGSVEAREPGLAVRVELVDTGDGARLWGRQYAFTAQETPAIHARIAADVAGALHYPMDADAERKLARRGTADPAAHDLYLQGRYYLNERTPDGLRKAIAQFEKAIAADPKFAQAYAGLADSYGLLAFGDAPPGEYFPKARAMAEKALTLDADLAEGYTSLGMVRALYDWQWAPAEAAFRRAVALNPGHATAHHWLAVHLNGQGRFNEAKDEFARALALDPLSRIIRTNAVYVAHYQRQYEAAIAGYRKVLETDDAFGVAREDLMLALEQAGRAEEAGVEAVLVLRQERPAWARPYQAARERGGHIAGLREWLRLLEQEAKMAYVSPATLAHLAIRAGDRDAAFRWLAKALAERSSPLAYLKTNPLYDPLRADPRFPALLRGAGL